jgi:hypothetical protein
MSIITVDIDLAKHVFVVHGVDDNGDLCPRCSSDVICRESFRLAATRTGQCD